MNKAAKDKLKIFYADDLLEEIERNKAELSASYGHDVHRLFEETRKHEKIYAAQGWKFAPLPEEERETSYALRDAPRKKNNLKSSR
jgi:hypothetical protein